MAIYQSLTKDERDHILSNMSEVQREFLHTTLKRGRASAFANTLTINSTEKLNENDVKNFMSSFDIEEYENLSNWELVEIIDAGIVDDSLKCECGRSLRYQYIVKNRETEKLLKLGRNHFAIHMGIPENVAQAVIRDLMKIDFELDEILFKFNEKKDRSQRMYDFFEDFLYLFPETYKRQFDLNLPFLDKQIAKITQLINENRKLQIQLSSSSEYDTWESDLPGQATFNLEVEEIAEVTEVVAASSSGIVAKDRQHKEYTPSDLSWVGRANIFSTIQGTAIYQHDLINDIWQLLNQKVYSANAIVEHLLTLDKYKKLFARCTFRMCYIIVTARITDAIIYDGVQISRESLPDRSDTYYF